MKAILYITAVNLLFVLVACTAEPTGSDAEGYFPTRSGDIILKDLRAPTSDAAMAVLHNSYVHALGDAKEASPYAVADFIAEALGLPHLTDESHESSAIPMDQYAGDVLNRPAANQIFSVVGLGRDELSDLKNIHSIFSKQSNSFTFDSTARPHTAVSFLTSLSSGKPPSTHGIIGHEWTKNGVTRTAFSDSGTSSVQPHIADLVSHAFNDALVVSISASPTYAGALYAHGRPRNGFMLTYDARANAFRPTVHPSAELTIPFSDLSTHMNDDNSIWSVLEANNVDVKREGETIKVSVAGQTAVFKLNKDESMLLFELYSMYEYPAKLQAYSHTAVYLRDEVPDFFAVTVQSLSLVAQQFGTKSQQYQVAAALVDAATPVIMKAFRSLYSREAVQELVLTGSEHTDSKRLQSARLKLETLAAQFTDVSNADLKEASPLSYSVNMPEHALNKFCSVASSQVVNLGYEVYCPSLHGYYQSSSLLELTDEHGRVSLQTVFTNSTTGTADVAAQRFQIILWLMIILVFAVYGAVYAIAYMDLKKDPLLYSRFNPNWNQKKHN